MKVDKVFICTYKYDFHFAKICVASVRYWYPDIPIYLIKDEMQGSFNTSFTEKIWNVSVVNMPRKKFGWGYGKLEVLFSEKKESFLVIDADTVLTGPVLDVARKENADFIVDREVQSTKRFNEIYYNLDRINELNEDFVYPGYSFNSGQWFGTSSIIKREDFGRTLKWSDPPQTLDKKIVVNNDQGHLNYVVHLFDQKELIKVSRVKLMIWPVNGNDSFIQVEKIRAKAADYPYVMHWAGMGGLKFYELPRQDILRFYKTYYYSRISAVRRTVDIIRDFYLVIERNICYRLRR